MKAPPPSLSTPPPASSPTPITPNSGNSLPVPAGVNCILGTPTGFHGVSIHLEGAVTTGGADSPEVKVLQGTGRSSAGAIAGVGRDLSNWVKRRINREPEIPVLVDKHVFQESLGFHKYILPVASIALATMSALHPADDGGGVLKVLMPLLLKLAGGGVLCRYLGEEYQLICPELAVIAMISSKMLGFASFYIVILKFLTGNPLCRVLVYLSGVMAVFPLVMVVVKIFKEDVRKPEEINTIDIQL